jgi:hypothetical protein
MLWDASAIVGYAIEARDGDLGSVHDFLIDDATWRVRWMVVDTGTWLPGRKVLIPASALGKPDIERKHFPVDLTREQVKASPAIDGDNVVSRQVEADLYKHYGREPYWSLGDFVVGAAATLFAAPFTPTGDDERPSGVAARTTSPAGPSLRSSRDLVAHRIHASDGDIGHVADLIVDDADWSVRYLEIDTTGWWDDKKVVVSPLNVSRIDGPERVVHLVVGRERVKNSPPYDPAMTIDGAYEEKFLTYYGIKFVKD